MRLHEIIVEDIDEGILDTVGRGLGKAAGATARGIGAIAGGAVGAVDAAKQGYHIGKSAVSGVPSQQPYINYNQSPANQGTPGSTTTRQTTSAAPKTATTPGTVNIVSAYTQMSPARRTALRKQLDAVDAKTVTAKTPKQPTTATPPTASSTATAQPKAPVGTPNVAPASSAVKTGSAPRAGTTRIEPKLASTAKTATKLKQTP